MHDWWSHMFEMCEHLAQLLPIRCNSMLRQSASLACKQGTQGFSFGMLKHDIIGSPFIEHIDNPRKPWMLCQLCPLQRNGASSFVFIYICHDVCRKSYLTYKHTTRRVLSIGC